MKEYLRVRIIVEKILLDGNEIVDKRTMSYGEIIYSEVAEFLTFCKRIMFDALNNTFTFLSRG